MLSEKSLLTLGISGVACAIIAYVVYRRSRSSDSNGTPRHPTPRESSSSAPTSTDKTEVTEQDDDSEGEVEDDNSKVNKVLVLGLDGSGKSALVSSLCGNTPSGDFTPTQGFSVVSTQHLTNSDLELWEIGGSKKTRKYWSNFFKDTTLVLYVIDSNDSARIQESKDALFDLMDDGQLARVPYIIVANKQDVADALSVEELARLLDVNTCPAAGHVQMVATYVPFAARHGGVSNLKRIIADSVAVTT